MKKYGLLGVTLLTSVAISFGQVESVEIKGDFKELGKLGRMQAGESLPTYSNAGVKGSRYLYTDWQPGEVISTANEKMDSRYVFMFDKQNNDLYIKQKDAPDILLAEKEKVKSFRIGNRQFVQGSQLPGGETGKFYELLAGNGSQYALYKQITTKFIKANRQDAERIKSGDFDDEFRDEINYFAGNGSQPVQKIKLTENSIRKAFPAEKNISIFFERHENDERDEQLFKSLIEDLNNNQRIRP
jgi:hypothetical protein